MSRIIDIVVGLWRTLTKNHSHLIGVLLRTKSCNTLIVWHWLSGFFHDVWTLKVLCSHLEQIYVTMQLSSQQFEIALKIPDPKILVAKFVCNFKFCLGLHKPIQRRRKVLEKCQEETLKHKKYWSGSGWL